MYQVTPIHYPSAVGFVAQQSKGLYKHLRTIKIILGWGSRGLLLVQSPKVVVINQCNARRSLTKFLSQVSLK